MRWFVIGPIAVALAGTGAVAVIQERDDDGDQTAVREFVVPWRLAGVDSGGRALKLAYDGGGCTRSDARATVTESRSTVRIRVRQEHLVGAKPQTEVACPAVLVGHTVTARLAGPIRGRSIEGGAPIASSPSTRVRGAGEGFLVVVIPRVVGLSAGDAVDLLLEQRFRPRIGGRRAGRVLSQRPVSGTRVRVKAVDRPFAAVTLKVGR